MVSNFCCCFSLKTSTIITGVVASVMSFLSLAEDIISMTVTYKPYDENMKDMEAAKAMANAHLSLTIICFHTVLVELVLSILLVYGACKEKPRFVKPWIYYTMVCLFTVDIALLIYVFIAFVYVGVMAGLAVLAPTVIVTMFGAYLIIVVNSYYRQLLGVDQPAGP